MYAELAVADIAGLHPLLQQTPLSVNPFVDLPKPPTLPHNYATLPSTLPNSSINAAPAPSDPDLPAYVTSPSGSAAHPSTIIKQNKALLEQLTKGKQDAAEKVKQWEQNIHDRELQEKRRRAPGWLDSDSKLLEPERVGTKEVVKILDTPVAAVEKTTDSVDDLGAAMDRAFGKSQTG